MLHTCKNVTGHRTDDSKASPRANQGSAEVDERGRRDDNGL